MSSNDQQITSIPSALLDAASEWIVKLSNQAADEADHQSFALWLSKSAQHKAAYDSIADLWFDLGCVRYIEPAELNASHFVEDQPAAGEGRPKAAPAKSSSFWSKLMNRRNVAASVAICAMAMVFLASNNSEQAISPQHFATAIGEQHSAALSDGSIIHLNTDSRLSVHYSKKQRLLVLSRGEAYFEVSKNEQRPFVVQVPGGSVTAVGTAFNIEISPQQTLVTVAEGVIRVDESNNSALPAQQMSARVNDRVSIHPVAGLERADSPNVADVTAWRKQNLVFRNASLAQVVAELNRYSDHKIKIADASLAYMQLNGVFKMNKPMETLQAIQTTLELESKTQGQIILLYKSS